MSKTYIITVHDEDVDYIEGILNGIRNSCRSEITIDETKPLPRVRRKKRRDASAGPDDPDTTG